MRDKAASSPTSVVQPGAAGKQRIVFVQYTNPAAYPPLEHASLILADNGWDVLFLGAGVARDDTRAFPPHERIEVRHFPGFGGGLAQKLNFATYSAWVATVTWRMRPDWLYVSDHLACPAALLARRVSGCKVAYHEHDAPAYRDDASRFLRTIAQARTRLAREADLCILPQPRRLEAFVESLQRKGPTLCVLNCPRREEVKPQRRCHATDDGAITFYYHGSINRDRLPMTVLDALVRAPANTRLLVVGYETIGSIGYMDAFMARTCELGVADRVSYLGALSRREGILAAAASADVGLAFMPTSSHDINMQHMAGASNKPFDYLAVGLALLVSDLPEWREMFVEPGFARACTPDDPANLADAMTWCAQNPAAIREMGEQGRCRIASTWNYETEFAKVMQHLSAEHVGG